MFGTIGHFRVKPGHEPRIRSLMDDWEQTMRPTIPGLVVRLAGQPVDRRGEMVEVILTPDEATYRRLAASPEQDAWYRRLLDHLDAEPTWEDINWTELRLDTVSAST